MPQEFSRARRVGDQIQREIAEMLQREVKDPRLGLVTVSSVDVSRDLAHAKVYVTFLDEEAAQPALKALARAAGFLRSGLARRLKLRTVPELRFVLDSSIVRGERLRALIEDAVAHDVGSNDNKSEETD
jgi:ribosome-binding factor A